MDLPASSWPPAVRQAEAPTPRLFTPQAMALATFFGSAIAGSVLYAWNMRALGRRRDGLLALLAGFAVTASLPVSGWWVVPVVFGIASTVLIVGAGAVMALQKSHDLGNDQSVEYGGDTTPQDAQRTADQLVELGYFGSESDPATVDLTKRGGEYTLGFYVQDGVWNDPAHVDTFVCLGASVREHALDRQPVRVELLDAFGNARRKVDAPLSTEPRYAKICGPHAVP